MEINYKKLLDDWGIKVLEESDKAEKIREDSKEGSYKDAHARGYGEGLRMALAMLNRMEKTYKNKAIK